MSQKNQSRVRSGLRKARQSARVVAALPASAHQHRGNGLAAGRPFDAPEKWHEPRGDGTLKVVRENPGGGYIHVVDESDIRRRVSQLPEEFQTNVEVVQLSRMTRKRRLFPCYGLQWGTAVYLYPIEASLEELYTRAPRPAQRIETEMFGGQWTQDGNYWRLSWTEETIRDYYLNNVLIHEIGHINDDRNRNFRDRERYADWFAIEYGYRASRRRRSGRRS
ncbi:MAG: hypothetical protein R3C20_11665 [Planctomycetaceae bacterium]